MATPGKKNHHYRGFKPFYREGVGLMIINENKKILIGRRYDAASLPDQTFTWQMPQGGIDFQESPLEAAMREMQEEIGTTNVSLLGESKEWFTYDFPKDLAKTLWGGRYDGQTQKWFLFKFLGYSSEININNKNPEFSQWRWAEPQDVLSNIVPFKKHIYELVFQEFLPIIISLP